MILRSSASAPASSSALTIEQLIDIKHPSAPAWSADGRHVSFTWDRAGVSERYVSDLDGRPPHVQPEPSGRGNAEGVASPDGTRVALVRSVGASAGANAGPASRSDQPAGRGGRGGRGGAIAGPSELWIRMTAGGQEKKLVTEDSGIGGVGWSPDGAYVLFTVGGGVIRHEQTPQYSGSKIIYTITENVPGTTMVVASGGGAPVASEHVARALPGAGGFGARRWLDASHFLVDRTSPDFKRRTTSVVDIETGQSKVLHEDVEEKFWSMTGDAGGGSQPSPDKKWIMFLSDRDGWDHIYVMAAEGGDATQITQGKFEAWRPQWSPDGTRIVFDANSDGHYGDRQLYVATLAEKTGAPVHWFITQITS
ncbi:MAG TPA: DPP IV N-terminal domain-containing protein, partial [Vicinamibacterales bacterium]